MLPGCAGLRGFRVQAFPAVPTGSSPQRSRYKAARVRLGTAVLAPDVPRQFAQLTCAVELSVHPSVYAPAARWFPGAGRRRGAASASRLVLD
jgi:hypothetical protein